MFIVFLTAEDVPVCRWKVNVYTYDCFTLYREGFENFVETLVVISVLTGSRGVVKGAYIDGFVC